MKDNFNDIYQYDDIINLPHHKSSSRPPMSRKKRAAQFSSFAALKGYEDAVNETARLTDKRINLDNDAKARLDEKLKIIQENLSNNPELTITYFNPDTCKTGGSYLTVCGIIKKIDYYERVVIMQDGRRIETDEIFNITGEVLKSLDDFIL